jgi:glycerophosphoryl diester phosphodiesterase
LRRAAALGCGWVEFDVRLTADAALVLCHDSRLDRTTLGVGRIASLPLQRVRDCDAGSWFGSEFAGEPIPTLDEALDLAIVSASAQYRDQGRSRSRRRDR